MERNDRRDGGRIEDSLPLKPQWFHILLALSEKAWHGSGIVRAVLDQTDGKLRLWPATVYGSLEDVGAKGWISELTKPAERPKGMSEKKRFYRITPSGARMLATEAKRLQSLASVALERVTSGEAAT